MYRGHLSNSEMPSAVKVLPVPGGPWRTAIPRLAAARKRASVRVSNLKHTDEALALALDDVVNALGGVVLVRFDECLPIW
jgi:hypothetical protein